MNTAIDANDRRPNASLDGPEHKPRSLTELGIRQTVLEDIALKILYLSGPMSTRDLSHHIKLGIEPTNELISKMRADQFCQVTGMSGSLPDLAVTSPGRARALELLARSQYAGAAPVSLRNYVVQARRQSVRNVVVHESDVVRAFGHLVIESKTLEEVGTALNSGASIFLYGPAGVGKTAIAETISRVLSVDDVWIPYAVEVDGNIIVVFDAMIHKQAVPNKENEDERWVRCHRPSVLVGGELTGEMLDLQLNSSTGFYVGPVQMKANNGVLILDDFGRQRTPPEELLNRWVVPLDRGIDFLTLAGGKKIEIPFEMLVVFVTNMNPAELVDAAFLRRIQTKIKIAVASDEQFCEIFRRLANERGVEVDSALLSELIAEIRGRHHQELRGCQPRDLINQIVWAARYKDKQPCLDRASLIKAAERYFLSES